MLQWHHEKVKVAGSRLLVIMRRLLFGLTCENVLGRNCPTRCWNVEVYVPTEIVVWICVGVLMCVKIIIARACNVIRVCLGTYQV